MQDLTKMDRTTYSQGPDTARPHNDGPNHMGGQYKTRQSWTKSQGWKTQDLKMTEQIV